MRGSERRAVQLKARDDCARDPRAYRRRLVLAALGGYSGVAAALVGSLAVIVAPIAIAIVVTVATVERARSGSLVPGMGLISALGLAQLGLLVRSLLLPEQIVGVELARGAAPALDAAIESMRTRVGAPRLREVRVTADAGIAIRPDRRVLFIGVQLFRLLSERELLVSIAHELAHLRGARVDTFCVRAAARWRTLRDALWAGIRVNWLIVPMARRFAPWFVAYSSALDRLREIEADEVERALDPEAAATSLQRLEIACVLQVRLERAHRRAVAERGRDTPGPTRFALDQVAQLVAAEGEAVLARLLADRVDTRAHPPLARRLEAHGANGLDLRPSIPASETLRMEAVLAAAVAELDAGWECEAEAIATGGRNALAKIAELEMRDDRDPGDDAQLACLYLEWDPCGGEKAMELLAHAATRHTGAALVFGLHLSARREFDEAERHLKRAAQDREHREAAANALVDIAEARGDHLDAARWEDALIGIAREDALAQQERESAVERLDEAGRPEVPEHLTDALREMLVREGVPRAWIVKIPVRHRRDQPLHLVLVEEARGRAALLERLSKGLATGLWVAVVERVPTRIKELPGAQLEAVDSAG